jgi:hypothetical protein
MVSFTKAAIVNSSLPHFMAAMLNSSPVLTFMFTGLLYESKSTPGILHTIEYNFTTIGTKSFHDCSCWYLFFSVTFYAVNVAIIVLLYDIKLEPARPASVCHLALFSEKKIISMLLNPLNWLETLLLSPLLLGSYRGKAFQKPLARARDRLLRSR